MPTIHIDGQAIEAASNQTVMQAAVAHGIQIPAFCWHPQLSIAGNCRVCAIHAQPSGRLRDLRQGGRMHAAGLPLPIQRRAVAIE
jgi:NADH dehydrogenase/NADH:ubiquinone oxidoreductase subunit G